MAQVAAAASIVRSLIALNPTARSTSRRNALDISDQIIRLAGTDDCCGTGTNRISLGLCGCEKRCPFGKLRSDLSEHSPGIARLAARPRPSWSRTMGEHDSHDA